MEKWINSEAIYGWLDLEGLGLLSFLILLALAFYKLFLKELNQERHSNIRAVLSSITKHFGVFLVFFMLYQISTDPSWLGPIVLVIKPYLGFLAFFVGLTVFIRLARLLALMYLFMGSMQAGVPLLLVNVFSLLLSISILFWTLSHVFRIQLGPLLATSAAFSIVLGLALQDTLGNLVAGVAIQIDDCFHIGNWLEVVNGINKTVGQVKDISWRSTTLIGLSDELIVIPNRILASSLISNFSPSQPIIRNLVFRVPNQSDFKLVLKILEKSAHDAPEVLTAPKPFAFVHEVSASWTQIKLIYWIESYGSQFAVGDRIYRKVLETLSEHSIELAPDALVVRSHSLS